MQLSAAAAWRRFNHEPAGAAAIYGLVAALFALGISLLLPRLFSDPQAVDPYQVRLSFVSVLLVAGALAWPRYRRVRWVLAAVAIIVLPNSLWLGTPEGLSHLGRLALNGNQQGVIAMALQLLLAVLMVVLAWRMLPAEGRPVLRLAYLDLHGGLAGVLGSALLLLVFLAIPAMVLGRVAIAPISILRDLPWVVATNTISALTQELQFRGVLMGSLERVLPRFGANLSQAAFFGLAHIAVQYSGPSGSFIAVAIGLGLVFGWLVQRTSSLWPVILIHALVDIAATIGVVPGLYGAPAGWWTRLGFPGQAVSAIVAAPADLAVKVSGGWMASLDGGRHFRPAPAPPSSPLAGFESLVISGKDAWALRDGRVFHSVAGGPLSLDRRSPRLGRGAHLLAAPAAIPGAVLAVGSDGMVWRRLPDGSWSQALRLQPRSLGRGPPRITSLTAFTRPLSAAVYLGVDGYSVLETGNAGTDWVRFGIGLPSSVLALATDSQHRSVYAGTGDGLWVHRLSSFPTPPVYRMSGLWWRWLLILGVSLIGAVAALLALRLLLVLNGWPPPKRPAGP